MKEKRARVENQLTLEQAREKFANFARDETLNSSPLYTHLSQAIAADPEMLALAVQTRHRQPLPNMLFAAVHFLLLKGAEHPLREFYASVTGKVTRQDDPYPLFKDFCEKYRAQILELLATRLVQTNEVQRSACLLPGFEELYRAGGELPLALIEIGSSAGLNLRWDSYAYDYGEGHKYGNPASPLQLQCTLQGDKTPNFMPALPPVAWRVGLDLNPIYVQKPDDVLWLEALVWPEHFHRAERLRLALQLAQQDPPRLLAGNALELLPGVLAEAPQNTTLGVFHSIALYQFSSRMREQFYAILAEFSHKRPFYELSLEISPDLRYLLSLNHFDNGQESSRMLARCHAHGGWLEWF